MPAELPPAFTVSVPGLAESMVSSELPASMVVPFERVTVCPTIPFKGSTMLPSESRLRTESSMTRIDPHPQRMPGEPSPCLVLFKQESVLVLPSAKVR